MSPSLHQFLITFVSAYRTNRPRVVVRRTTAALQCLSILRQWGLLSHYGAVGGAEAVGIPPRREPQSYLMVWFHPWPPHPTLGNQRRGQVVGQPPHLPSGRGSHRLEVVRYPSRRHRLFRSHRWLRGRLPHRNTLYLIQTLRGIVTSEEALRHRMGGVILLAVHL